MTKALLFFSICFLYSNLVIGQTVDTLRYKSIGNIVDTFYYTKERLSSNTYKVTRYHGLSDNSNLSSSVDTFIIAKNKWRRYYKNRIIPFLSVKTFNDKTIVNEFLNKDSLDYFYNKCIPVKKIVVDGKNFYLYRIVPMYGKGMDQSLGNGPYHIVFNFSVGEVYRSTYHITKVLEGFEEYTKYFKW
jgi:hypothetical protein